MVRFSIYFVLSVLLLGLTACRHPMRNLHRINLGMTADDVREEMGNPYSVRSAKLFEGEETTMVWEYWPPFINNNPDKIHVVFENGRVVQWGTVGDYGTMDVSTGGVKPYTETRER